MTNPSQHTHPHTITALLEAAVNSRPDHLFLRCGDTSISYRDFDRRSTDLAVGLQARGVAEGDTVATLLDNSIELILLWFATNKLGAIWVPINTALKGGFLSHQISDALARLVVVEAHYLERFAVIEADMPGLAEILVRGEFQPPPFQRLVAAPLAALEVAGGTLAPFACKPSDVAMLVFTSGTTGRSKACMISHRYGVSNGEIVITGANRGPDDVGWTCLPLFHLNAVGSVVAAIITAGTLVVAERFSLSRFWDEIAASGATIVNAMGVMIPLIAQCEDSPAMDACRGQVRVVVGAPFDERLQTIYRERFGVQRAGANAYGMTEASVMTSLAYSDYAKPGTSGKANDLFEVQIVDDGDEPVAPGQAGEVVCRPKKPWVMFSGYWQRPQDTLDAFRNLWFHTGDIGRFDEDGYFHFVDRKKDYIRRSGENISSMEVEAVFMGHPAIREVAAHGVKSALGEDEVKITLVRQPEASASEEEICRWSLDRLPHFAVPRYIEFRDSLPVNPVNKVMKHLLRDEGVTATTWDRLQSDIVVNKR